MSGFNTPKEVAEAMVSIGKKKVSMPFLAASVLGILAGVYIGFGAQIATTVSTTTSKFLGFGISKFLAGSVFSVGLMLVVIAGAELFTGNNLIVKAVLKGEVTWAQLVKSWVIIYIANFIGSLIVVFIVYLGGLYASAGNELGATALKIANAKVNLSFAAAFFRGILCNWLVCLAVWLCIAAKDVTGKIWSCFFPIMTFVACGYEHSIANMFFIPMGVLLKNQPQVLETAGLTLSQLGNLTWVGAFTNNILAVSLGNIIGGAVFVGTAYFFVYLRD
ncbi:formate/nitrite transporter family protein [Candidatus Margulisiibacteriota bacterium]